MFSCKNSNSKNKNMARKTPGILQIFAILVAIFGFEVQNVASQSFLCPPRDVIAPAYCIEQPSAGYKLELFLQFTDAESQRPLNQSVIDNLFDSTRITNDLSIDQDWLQVHRLNMWSVNLNPINLSSLARVRMDELHIENCPVITEISDGPRDQSLAVRSVTVPEKFGDQEFRQLLSYFSPPDLETLIFAGTRLTEDFIPFDAGNNEKNPLEPFKFLQGLYISKNQIKNVRGGQFRHSLRLKTLSLGYQRIELDENAFWFNQPDEGLLQEMSSVVLRILLQNSNLTDERIHPNLGLHTLKYRPVTLELENNDLATVNASKWEEFLYAHPENKMVLSMNLIVCDERVKWLKDAREKLEKQVLWTECVNDPGKTVFDSDLIP